MADENNKQRGQWVFRNQRWHYLPADVGPEPVKPSHIDPANLLSLVDGNELLGSLKVLQRLYPQPILLSIVEPASAAGEQGELNSLSPMWPDWWHELEALLPGLSAKLLREMVVLASSTITLATQGSGNCALAKGGLYCLPVSVTLDNRVHLPAVVTALAAAPENIPGGAALAANFGVTLQAAEAAIAALTRSIDSTARAEAYRAMLDTTVRTYSQKLQIAAEHRQDLAAEQARGRHALLRAENLERQLLRGSTEVERATDAGGLPVRELAAILDNPQIGITIEDDSYGIRYQNPMLRQAFGNQLGRKCYEAFKGRTEPCQPCPIHQIWREGRESVRYTITDPRSGRSFEVSAFPLVGEQGDKLIVEVGVEVTDLIRYQSNLQKDLGRSKARVAQLHSLLAELAAVLKSACSNVTHLLKAGDSDGLDTLRDSAGATLGLAEALSLPPGSGTADAPQLLQEILDEWRDEGHTLPEIRMPVMPDIPVPGPHLKALFQGLMGHLLASTEGRVPDLDLSHTMSGTPDTIAPGDAYHLLFLGPRRRSAEFAEDEVSTLPALSGETELIAGASGVHLAQASLVARRLGGTLWRQLQAPGTVTYFLSLPVERAD